MRDNNNIEMKNQNEEMRNNKNSLICCRNTNTNSSKRNNNDDGGDGDEDEAMDLSDYTNGNNNTIFQNENYDAIGPDHRFPKREAVNIAFEDIRYRVRFISSAKRSLETKEILHGINGTFKAGKLTAIMGPSGAGKSSLLNILADYVCSGVTGTVRINGKTRPPNSEEFRRLSCYIHQDDALRNGLTVYESMLCAAHLKLGYEISIKDKHKLIKKILFLLGLDKRKHTFTANLSGGQRKRLTISLEMLNNPPVLFLDEPTTGLDSSASFKCISMLKRLALDGRTIICTIHQPSALIFEMFDTLYTLTAGQCIYQGRVQEVLPFLQKMNLTCPSYHNPADFLMEVAVGEFGTDIPTVIEAANKKYRDDLLTESTEIVETEKLKLQKNDTEKQKSASTLMQFILLYQRNLLCASRNYHILIFRFLAHICISGLFGYLYIGVGPMANKVLANYVYLYGSILLNVYTGKAAVMISFPIEMEVLTREHFNRWYGLGPYFLAILCFEVPFQSLCSAGYVMMSYFLTGNYLDNIRFYYFIYFTVLTALCAQSWGFFIGATLPIRLAVFIGPVLAVLFGVFGFCTPYVDITPLFRWMWHISYFRAGFHGVLNTVYGMNRTDLHCPEAELYCHFKNPRVFQKDMDIEHIDNTNNLILMGVIIFTLYFLTTVTLWIKLNRR